MSTWKADAITDRIPYHATGLTESLVLTVSHKNEGNVCSWFVSRKGIRPRMEVVPRIAGPPTCGGGFVRVFRSERFTVGGYGVCYMSWCTCLPIEVGMLTVDVRFQSRPSRVRAGRCTTREASTAANKNQAKRRSLLQASSTHTINEGVLGTFFSARMNGLCSRGDGRGVFLMVRLHRRSCDSRPPEQSMAAHES